MKKRMRKVQIIAIVLSTLMLLNIPLPAFAEAAVENAIEEAQNQPVLMTDKLTETETYWQNADGSITYEESLTPIRYQDEKGNWHDIVNDIVQVDKSEESKDAFKNDSYDYRSESSKAWVLLDENIRNSAPIKLQFGAYTLTSRPVWGNLPIPDNTDESLQEKADPIATETPQLADGTLEDTEGDEQEGTEEQPTPSPTLHVETAPQSVKQNQAVKSEELESRISFIEKQKEQEEGAQRQRVPAANTDTEADPYTYSSEKEYEAVEYSNVFGAGTTLRLTPTNEGYKEDIILFERPEQASFSFELNVTGLVLELDENNVVWMKDAETEEVIGFLPQPYMEDSSILEEGVNDSTDIVVTLEEKENGRYLYTLTPSAEWLDAETTVYPVKIDPSASISGSNQKDKDVTDTGKPYTNAYQYLRVGRDTDGHKYRAYIQFTLPSNLTGSYVTAATLNTYQTYSGTSSPTFAVHRVNGSWTSAGITWSNQPSFSSGSYASQAVSGVKNYTWNMRTMVQEWANGTANNGLVIKATDETPKRYKRFASSDSASNKPSLSITYYPVNLTINASGTSGSINSSQGSINVSWVAPPSGVTAKVVLDGKEYSPNNANGANTHKFSGVSSYVSHKVKVRFTGTNFDRSTAEKTIKLEDRTPPIFNTTSEVSVVDGQLNVKMNPAVKPNSIQSVAFPTWTSNDGQDDIKWYAPAHNGNGDWSYTVDIGTHGNQTGVYNVHCYARTAEGTYAAFALCDFNFAELTEYSGRLFAPPNGDQPVAVKVTVKKISATKFTVTAVGVQESESIAEHQIYWQEVDSEEKHYLPAITGDVKQGMISKSYDIKESGMPSGATIRLYASAKDKFGNFTPAGYLLGTVDIPNYVSPQAPQLLAQSGTRTYLGGEGPSFAVKDHIQIIWKVEKGTGSNYDVGTIQYSFDKQNWITVSVDDWLNKGEGYTIKENGIEISVADKSDGIIPLYVRALDNNEIAEERLAGPESTIQILKDAAAPVLQITYPQSVQEIEGIPQWDISNPVLIDQIQEDSLEMIKVEAGQYIDLLGQDVIPIYQVITEIPGETVTNETLPLHVLLGSCGLHDAKYQLRITATDKAGNESVYTQDFYLMTSMTYEAKGIELSSTDVNDTPSRIKLNTVPKTITFQEDPVMDADKEYRFITKLLRGEGIDVTVDGTTRTIQIDALGDLAPGMPKPFYLIVEQMETGERMYSSPAFKDGTQDTLVYRADTSTEIEKRFEGTLSEGGPGIIDRIRITGTQETMDGDIIYTVSFYDNNDQLIEQKTVQGTVGAISPEGIAYKYKIDAVIENTANSYEAIRVVHETTYIGIATELQNELVAPVAKVSAIPQVNYTTRLRWEASPTENIVYDVYRNTQDSFEGAALLASNLPTTYYYDHDWVDNKEFFYWVVAKKSFAAEGETPAYASSAAVKTENSVKMVSADELNKMLGKQEYWSFATVPAGNASGYINVTSGNLVYEQIDTLLTAPLLSNTLQRTYNSQSTAMSAFGYGWDFSFNTNLLREYNGATGEEVGLILKDGDGTIHRFVKQEDGSYRSPAGIFITLTQREDGKFIAHRSDDIEYLFNESMMIEEFSEPNGNKLMFTYDNRGNLTKVMHSAYATKQASEQQFIQLDYGTETHNLDKIIGATCYYGEEGGLPQKQVYQYTYDSTPDSVNYGRLIDVRTTCVQTNSVIETNESGSENVTSLPYQTVISESYEYTDTEEGRTFAAKVPSNTSASGIRTYTFQMDAQGRVTGTIDALSNHSEITYMTHTSGAPTALNEGTVNVVETTVTPYIGEQNTGATTYYTDANLHGVLTRLIQPGDRITNRSEYSEAVLKPGKITSYADADHQKPLVYDITYNTNGTVAKSIAPNGLRTEYTYIENENGLTDWVASERVYQNSNNALLDRREYTYDAKGNLLTQKVAVSNPASGEWNHRCTTHTYYANGLIQSTVEWNGKKTGYTYDERGNLILQKLNNRDSLASSYTYDIRNNMKTESVHRGSKKLTKTYVHDEIGRIREVLYADGQREINDYNRSGLLVSKVIVGAPASDGGTTQAKRSKYVYDNLDRVVSMTDPEGNVTKTIYGVTGNATVVTTNIMAREDSESVVRSTVAETAFDGSYSSEKSGTLGEKTYYDYQGNETKTVQLYKDAEGWKETRAMHSETDTQGRVIRQWNEVTRTESGKLAEEDYTEVRTDYDALGNPIRQWTLASKNGDTKQYSVKQYTYDLLGRVLSVRERTGLVPYSNANIGEQASDIVTTYTYDAIQSDGVSMDTQVQAGGKQTNTYYNSLGQVVKEVQTGAGADAPTITKEYQYDAYGRQVKMLEQGVVRYQYGYDDYDRIIKQTTGSASENNVHETQLTYDHFSRRAAMKDIVDNVEILTTWKYDKNDQAIQLLQDGKVVFYAYDEAGDMTAMQYGANGNIRTIQYDLDSMGRLTAIRSGTQTLTEEAEGVVQTNDVKTVKTYGYDAIGDLTSTMEYAEFDTKADGQGLAVTGTFTYDDAGRPLTTVYAQNDVQKEKYTMKYDNKGNVVSETYIDSYADSFTSNKTITTIRGYQYDAVGRMTENTVTKREGDTQTGQKTIGYTYDRIGNRLTETNSQTYDNGSSNATKTYTYDGLDRLLKVTENGKVTTNVGEQSYNQILAEYGYDTYGNQTSQKVYELDIMNANSKLTAEIRHTYDAANQLIETEEKKQGQDWKTMTVNRYNGEGQRVRKIEDGMADGDFTRYFYMSGALAFSTNSDPNYISDENILDLNGKVVAARRSFAQLQEGREESQYWTFHYDARGSVTNVVGANNTGALYRVENNVYDAFGQDEKPETPQTQIKNEVKFTGAVQDNSGLYYMGSRHYDPSTGRYIQQDVLQGDPYSPWTQNRYAYCGGNPSSYIDPTGHLLGALFGGLFGGLWGGIKSALNGDGFWKGAASGAAKGFITGAGIDIALATGGVGIPLAISAVGGAIGGATGDVIEQVFDIDAGRRASIDGWQILGAGFAGAAEGLLGYGIGVYGGGRHIVEGTWAQRFSSDLGLVQSGKDLAEVVISAAAEETSAVILEEASGARRKPIVTRNRNTKKKTIHASSTKQALEVVNNSNGAIRDSDKVNLGNSCHITVGMIRPGSGQYRHPSTWFSPTNPYRWC